MEEFRAEDFDDSGNFLGDFLPRGDLSNKILIEESVLEIFKKFLHEDTQQTSRQD